MKIEEDIDELYKEHIDEWLDDNSYEKLIPMGELDTHFENSTPTDIMRAYRFATNYGHGDEDDFDLNAEYFYFKGDGNIESVSSYFYQEWCRDQVSEKDFKEWCVENGYATEVEEEEEEEDDDDESED